jgi:predicted heme/steroid binding protein
LLKQSSIRIKKVLAILLLVLFVVSVTAAIVSAAAEMHNATKTSKIKEFTLEELAKYNGKNMKAAYVANQGIVYDVSNSYLWKNGEHKGHHAGRDLTEEIGKAAHGPGALMGFPVVGTLKNDSNSSFITRAITRITHIV